MYMALIPQSGPFYWQSIKGDPPCFYMQVIARTHWGQSWSISAKKQDLWASTPTHSGKVTCATTLFKKTLTNSWYKDKPVTGLMLFVHTSTFVCPTMWLLQMHCMQSPSMKQPATNFESNAVFALLRWRFSGSRKLHIRVIIRFILYSWNSR